MHAIHRQDPVTEPRERRLGIPTTLQFQDQPTPDGSVPATSESGGLLNQARSQALPTQVQWWN